MDPFHSTAADVANQTQGVRIHHADCGCIGITVSLSLNPPDKSLLHRQRITPLENQWEFLVRLHGFDSNL